MTCTMKECPGEMEAREITHTFIRKRKPFVVEGIPAHVCPICGYALLDLHVLDQLLAFNPDEDQPYRQAPVYRLKATGVAA